MKILTMTIIGVIGTTFSWLFGGFDSALIALCILMAFDIITGFTNALVFKKSKKTTTGAASSSAGIKGITRKFLILVIVVVAFQMDILMKTHIIRDGVIIAYAAMEALSIIENIGFMGLPIPKVLRNAIEILNDKEKKVLKEIEEIVEEDTE